MPLFLCCSTAFFRFNLRVPPTGQAPFTGKLFTPLRFGTFLALLVFASFPQVILGLETFVARDFGFFAYPLAHFQADCLRHGELPFWDPYNNCGVPFLAQWNTMPLYPPALFYLALPLTWALGMFSLLHLWWAGLGLYFLARRWTGNDFAAAFAGVAFAFNGFTLNLIMWPSHIATFSWLPWVVLLAERAWRDGWHWILFAAFAGALQMLAGGPEIILFTWLIVTALWLQQLVIGCRDASSPARGALLWRYPLVVALVISLTLAQLLPFLDLVAHAQRTTGFADLRWSMPGSGLANFLVPMAFGSTAVEGIFFQHGQYWTSSYYLGLAPLWLALLALACWRERRVWLLAALALAGLLLALGEHTPVLPLLRRLLPQLSFITYPIKYVALVIVAAPLLAAFALADFTRAHQRLLPLGGVLLALLAGVLLWTHLASLPGDVPVWFNGLTRAGFLIATGILLYALTRTGKAPLLRWVPLLLLLVLWADLDTEQPAQNPTVPPLVYAPQLARDRLALTPPPALGGPRVMVSPLAASQFINFALPDPKNNFLAKRLGYCANANLLDATPKLDGFFSLTPSESDAVQSILYASPSASHPGLEDFLGVAHRTAPDEVSRWQARPDFLPLVTAGQSPVFFDDPAALAALAQTHFDGARLVILPGSTHPLVTVTNPGNAKILQSSFGNDTVDIAAEALAPALVVVAQTYYHNWRAEVDGAPVPLLRANVAFQAVQIPAGKHTIHLYYQDRAFAIGAAISVCMWVNCGITLLLLFRRTLPPTPPDPDDEDNYL